MGQDVTSLVVRIESLEAELASKRLNTLTKSGAKAERSTSRLTSQFTSMIAPLTAVVSAYAAFDKLITDTRALDKLEAGLVTATGSVEKANAQFKVLEEFATSTPFALEQSVEAFIKLTNLGLTPSERALKSYGNTASAMGKDLNQMIEAVADATTNEFERLKEFGIKAKQTGSDVTFTFRGIATTVAKNSTDIEEYLTSLGENNFGDAMNNRMKTLDGALSNLQDEWDRTFRIISKSDIGASIEEQARNSIDWLSKLNNGLDFVFKDGLFSSELNQAYEERLSIQRRINEATLQLGKSFDGSRFQAQLMGERDILADQILLLEKRLGLVIEVEMPGFGVTADKADPFSFTSTETYDSQIKLFESYNDKKLRAQKIAQEKAERLSRGHNQSLLNSSAGLFGALAAFESGASKASFERQKKWMYAETVLSTIASAQAAYYSAAKFGPLAAAAAASTAALAGAARLAQISRTSFDTSSTPTIGGGSIPFNSDQDRSQSASQSVNETVVTQNIYGNFYGDDALKDLVREDFKEAINTNRINLSTPSGERVRVTP